MDNWAEKMEAVIASKRILDKLNVIDVSFTDGHILEVYVAISREERSSGLQSIPYLDVDGMMFFYEQPSYNPFTMKDVGFSLDIGWYDTAGRLIRRGTYEPGFTSPIFSPKPYSYVIETLAGKLPASDLKVANV